ncbi:MAG TPA: PhnD/SsuA/transferrin family substrate-binding protein, partial [Burkholderiales bacterium]
MAATTNQSPRARGFAGMGFQELFMQLLKIAVATLALLFASPSLPADPGPLRFGVGLFQPDRERNDATYRPLADYLAKKLGREVRLFTVDTWEGLAKSLASGETDIALMGPWGYVLANHTAGAQAAATILYDGKAEYFA